MIAVLGGVPTGRPLALEDAIARWWERKHPEPTVEGFAEAVLRVIQVAA